MDDVVLAGAVKWDASAILKKKAMLVLAIDGVENGAHVVVFVGPACAEEVVTQLGSDENFGQQHVLAARQTNKGAANADDGNQLVVGAAHHDILSRAYVVA